MRYLWAYILTFMFFSSYAQKYNVHGLLIDKSNGSRIADAIIYDSVSTKNTTSDSVGKFKLKLQTNVNLVIIYLGKTVYQIDTTINSNTFLKIKLNPSEFLDEVIIEEERVKRVLLKPKANAITISLKELKLKPIVAGQSDVFKGLQFIPGVSSGKEGSSELIVRGGNNDQNLVLIDGAPVFGNFHLGGYISPYEPDFFDSVKFYKSGFAVNHGGRLSSIVDMSLTQGSFRTFKAKANIGLMAEGFSVSGPLIKDKLSIAFGARRFNYDFIARPATYFLLEQEGSAWYNFSDYNLKLALKKSMRSTLSLSLFYNRDKIAFRQKYFLFGSGLTVDRFTTPWHNKVASFNWNFNFSERSASNLTLYYSRFDIIYKFNSRMLDTNERNRFKGRKSLTETGIKWGVSNAFGKLQLNTGIESAITFYTPLHITERYFTNGELIDSFHFGKKRWGNALSITPYFSVNYKFSKKLRAQANFRNLNYYFNNTVYHLWQPRFRITYGSNINNAYLRYDKMAQPFQSIMSYSNGLGLDNWTIATDRVPPAQSEQISIGLNTILKDWSINIEAYLKRMQNLAAYKNGYALADLNDNWENSIWTNGRATGKGVEVLASKSFKIIDVQWAYTLAWHQRRFWRINRNQPFWYLYDERHRFDIQLTYEKSKNIIFSANWTFGSGLPITLAKSTYLGAIDATVNYYGYDYHVLYEYDGLNNQRMQMTHRLDIGVSIIKEKIYGTKTINFGLYNAYNRMNPNLYVYREFESQNSITGYERRLSKVTFFPIMPYFSINYSFNHNHVQQKLSKLKRN